MPDTNSKCILIVEDEPTTAQMIGYVLGKKGYQTIIAPTGEKAVEIALGPKNEQQIEHRAQQQIDLILMDIELGMGINGLTAAKRILEHRFLPIVFHTRHQKEYYFAEIKNIIRFGYVLKDHGIKILESTIEMALDLIEMNLKSEAKYKDLYALLEKPENYMLFQLQTISNKNMISQFSPSIQDILGIPDKSLGIREKIRTWYCNIHPEDRKRIKSKILLAKSPPFIFQQMMRYLHPQKGLIWLEIRAKAFLDIDNGQHRLTTNGIIIDISDQISDQMAEQMRQKHIKNILASIRKVNQWITKSKNATQLIQQSCYELTEAQGYTNAWIALIEPQSEPYSDTAKPILIDIASQKIDRIKEMKNNILAGHWPYCIQKTMQSKSVMVIENPIAVCGQCPHHNEYLDHAAISCVLSSDDKIYGTITCTIAKQFACLEEEKTIFQELANDLGYGLHFLEIKNTLQQKQEQLALLNASKDKFFAIMAHDLRGPIGGAYKLTEMILENLYEYSYDEIYDLIKTLYESSSELFKLVSNLLEWTRIQREKAEYNPKYVELGAAINRILSLYKNTLATKNIQTRLYILGQTDDLPVYTFADENMLHTILRNLINNAIKYSFQGGRIEIYITEIENQFLQISVQDFGIGIKEDQKDNILTLDQKSMSMGTSGEQGSGLGLILIQEYISMHGGKLWFESQPGQGSIFHFTLKKHDISEPAQ